MRWVRLFRDELEAASVVPPGKMRVVRVADLKICLVHKTDSWYAIQDACPHLGESLSRGHLNAFGDIICPLHAYRFQLSSGREAMERCKDAKVYPIRVQPEGIFIGLPAI
jgi:3-phenylpropionate/trans-cinnamate dioxygenase ferredoxin subunit